LSNELAKSLKLLTGRILRYIASVDQVQETSRDTFAANKTTKILARPQYGGFIYHEFHTVGNMMQAFPKALAAAGYRDVEQVPHAVQKKAFSTDLSGFEWLRSEPRRWEAFQQAMSINAQARVPWFTVFPLETELGSFLESKPGVPAFVDIGGGFGHQCGALAAAIPRLKGRLVVQDMAQTVAIAPPLDGVEAQAHDFFEAQPLRGAKFYYLRCVLHDWPRDKAAAILSRVREAMEPGVSQLLIDEIVVPNSGAHWQAACRDMLMMMGAGASERTVDEWTDLLDEAGLRVVKIHTYLPRHQDSIIQAVAK
jgi:demethylsterigmatocystin 6-O-methyltransferase